VGRPLLCFLTENTGQSGLGKTTFVNTLFSRVLSLPKDYSQRYEAIGDDEKITVTEAGESAVFLYQIVTHTKQNSKSASSSCT